MVDLYGYEVSSMPLLGQISNIVPTTAECLKLKISNEISIEG